MSGGMNFQLTIELITKGMDAFNKAVAAEKAMAEAGKAANAATVAGANKAEAALHAEANAAKQVEAANRAVEASAKTSGAAQAASASRMARATEAASRAFASMKAGASSVGAAISASFGKAMTAVGRVARASMGVGAEFAKGVAAGVAAELGPRLKGAMQNAWTRATGYTLASGPGAFRANAGIAAGAAAQQAQGLMSWAASQALSNVRSASEAEERLRADLGADGARKALAAADKAMVSVPFGRDDVRAALPDMIGAGIDPASDRFRMIADAAAANGKTMAEAAAAYKAASGGDLSALSALGIGAKAGDDGKASLVYRALGQDMNVGVDANNAADVQAKVDAAMQARYSDAAARKAVSIDGMVTKASNSWDTFIGKVMNAGPLDFFKEKMGGALKGFDEAVQNGNIDKFANEIGAKIKQAMMEGEQYVKGLLKRFDEFADKVRPAIDAIGGLTTALKALAVVGAVNAVASLVGPLWAMAGAMGAVSVPALLVVGAVAAIAAAAVLIYTNWDKIGPMLSRIWEAIKSGASTAWEAIATGASEAWNSLSTAAGDAWKRVRSGAEGAWKWVSESVSSGLASAETAIKDWGGTALTAMQGAFGKVQGWFNSAVSGLGKAWDGVKNAAAGALAYVGLGKDATPEEKQAAERQRAISDAGRASEAIALLNDLQGLLPTVAAAVAGFDLAGPINTAIGAARGALAGVSFHAEGVAMMQTLAAGIEAGAAKAVAAVHKVTQQMRDYLPHSPAKVGPLSDLDQVRFSETLASAIRPDPAVAAVRSVAAGMAAAIGGGPQIGVRGATGMEGSGGAGGGNVSVSYAPNIVIPPGREQDGRYFEQKLREHASYLTDLVRREWRQDARLNYRER